MILRPAHEREESANSDETACGSASEGAYAVTPEMIGAAARPA
jgi:hypothetical protein